MNTLYRLGIERKYYTRHLSLDEKKLYMDLFVNYIKFKYIKKYINANEAEVHKKKLEELEEAITFDQILSIRQASTIKINYLMNLESINDKVNNIKNKWRVTCMYY